MRVLEFWRYPVKSLQGERLDTAGFGPEGIAGDRQWALFDVDTGYGLTARRVPELLFAAARLRADGGLEVVLPDGTVTSDDGVVSAWLGRRVTLRAAGSAPGRPRYESPDDDLAEAAAPAGAGRAGRWHDWQGAPGAFHDNADGRVSLVTTGTLGNWDRRRFRANVVLDGRGEEGLIGSRVRIGGVDGVDELEQLAEPDAVLSGADRDRAHATSVRQAGRSTSPVRTVPARRTAARTASSPSRSRWMVLSTDVSRAMPPG